MESTSGRKVDTELFVPLGLFAASRVVVFAGAWVAHLVSSKPLAEVLTAWDSGWYIELAKSGYPDHVLHGSGTVAQSTLNFFPGYPLLIRAVVSLTPAGPRAAAVLIAVVFAAVASVALYLLVRDIAGASTATKAVALFVFFPGSFVLSMGYSEGLFLAAAILAFRWVLTSRWVLAGVACSIATATRPTGIVVLACVGLAAVMVARQRRSLRPLVAPLLGSVGIGVFTIYLAVRTGNPLAWMYSQEHGWGQGFDFGRNTMHQLSRFVTHPLADTNVALSMLFLAAVAALVLAWVIRPVWRPHPMFTLYTIGILAPAVFSASLYSTARFAMTAFPLFIATARRLREVPVLAVVATFAGGLALLMVLSGGTNLYTP